MILVYYRHEDINNSPTVPADDISLRESKPDIRDPVFRKIEYGMTVEQVAAIVGSDGEDIGSGTIVERYDADSGEIITITYIIDQYGVFRVARISVTDGT